jgi:hypothetical protein
LDIGDRHRPPEQVALRQPAACGENSVGLRRRLDAFGDDLDAERVAQPDDRAVQRFDPSRLRADRQTVALSVYHVVALAFAEIPLVSALVAPDRTQTVMLRVHDWVLPRRRQLIAVIIAVVAALLVVNGIGSL